MVRKSASTPKATATSTPEPASVPTPFGSHYVRYAHIAAFGSSYDRNIGPFEPGLNVVYGENEAGKTTVNSFFGGLLFGWPEARGGRNAYKPQAGERSGTLSFAPRDPAGEEISCSRAKNNEGLKPDPHPSVLADIDEETYQRVFALDSDELLGLGDAGGITSHLLTAGAGTKVSPAKALDDVDAALAACFSRSTSFPDSIPNLQAELDLAQTKLQAATEEQQRFKKEAREFAALAPRMEQAETELETLTAEVELLLAQCNTLERLDQEAAQLQEEDLALARREADLAARLATAQQDAEVLPFANNDARMRSLRDELEDLHERQYRIYHDLDVAQDDYAQAKAAYASIAESASFAKQQAAQQRRKRFLHALSVVLPTVFVAAALFMFLQFANANTTVFLVVAIVFTVAAIVFAALGPFTLARMSAAPSSTEEQMAGALRQLEEAEQAATMATEKAESFAAQVEQSLERVGLGAAEGDLRYARALLDDAREARGEASMAEQEQLNVDAARAAYRTKCERVAEARQAAFAALGEAEDVPVAQLRARLAQKQAARDALQSQVKDLSSRYGELTSELDRATLMGEFGRLKMDVAQLQTRMVEAKENFAQLLVVHQMLASAIKEWERKSQPEVYAAAGKLLSQMTNGAWVGVRMNAEGELVAVDKFGTTRDTAFLSLGTRQQLYLAVRIALLMTAENVGTSIPILADDILVNFDAERRRGAALALEELSRVRQVILFTCHKEVVSLMQDSCPQINLVKL